MTWTLFFPGFAPALDDLRTELILNSAWVQMGQGTEQALYAIRHVCTHHACFGRLKGLSARAAETNSAIRSASAWSTARPAAVSW